MDNIHLFFLPLHFSDVMWASQWLYITLKDYVLYFPVFHDTQERNIHILHVQ